MIKRYRDKFGIFLVAILAIIFAWGIITQIISTLKSEDRLQQTTDKLHELEVQNQKLKQTIKEVDTSQYLEQEARDKLGLVKEGETLVIIPDEKINQILGESKREEKRLPNWQGWLRLFVQ